MRLHDADQDAHDRKLELMSLPAGSPRKNGAPLYQPEPELTDEQAKLAERLALLSDTWNASLAHILDGALTAESIARKVVELAMIGKHPAAFDRTLSEWGKMLKCSPSALVQSRASLAKRLGVSATKR